MSGAQPERHPFLECRSDGEYAKQKLELQSPTVHEKENERKKDGIRTTRGNKQIKKKGPTHKSTHPPQTKKTPLIQNDSKTRTGIHANSLALKRCPVCDNLHLSECTIGGANEGLVSCANCGNLSEANQQVARCRKRRLILAIFAPDADTGDITQLKPNTNSADTDKKALKNSTRHNRREQTKMAPPTDTDATMGTTDVNKGDLTLSGVPDYDEIATDDQELSLKEMLSAMRSEFRVIGKKVAVF